MLVEYVRGETHDVMIQVEMPVAPNVATGIRTRSIDWVVYKVDYVYSKKGGIGGQYIGAVAYCAAIPDSTNKIGEEHDHA